MLPPEWEKRLVDLNVANLKEADLAWADYVCISAILVMREGHLWGKKEVTIPLSAIGDTHEDTVFLKLDKKLIESLPIFP
jgi:hypothetical protein